MTKFAQIGCVVSLAILPGCGGGLSSTSDAGPPHGGTLVLLPGGTGAVEIVKKAGDATSKEVSGEVAFYFLQPGNAPMSPAPASGKLTVGKKAVTLKADGDSLVTPTGPRLLPTGPGLDGVLTVELGGKTLSIPLGVR